MLRAHGQAPSARPAPQGLGAVNSAYSCARSHHSGKDVPERSCRHAATVGARSTGPDDLLVPARERTLGSLAAVLHGYRLGDGDQIHALRMLRSVLHGFAMLEASDGFQMSTDVADSFTWMVDFIDKGLRTSESSD